jgi:K+-sensing histidine kinase KdpD
MVDSMIGALLCAVTAAGATALAAGHSWQAWIPLVFVAMLLVVSAVFGMHAGILGTLLSAIIFAEFLFHPVGSFRIANEAARSNLAWMLLLGISFSFLFAPPTGGLRRH